MVAVLAISSFANAGGDIAPIEPVVEVESHEIYESSFYVGLGYSYINSNNDAQPAFTSPGYGIGLQPTRGSEIDITGDAFTLIAGYNFNKYFAVEGRYSATFGDLTFDDGAGETDFNGDISNLALYLKPMYPIGGLTLYGLLGYGEVTVDDAWGENSESDFQWGIGASYAATENVSIFVDYTVLYDDSGFDSIVLGDYQIDAINIGITYTF